MPRNINTARLKQLIREKFGSPARFVEVSGMSKQYVSEVLRGKIDPSLERVIQFADLLGVCVDDLLIRPRDSA
jgi:transcriptional regulator with XRE-family HTH domain